MFVPNSSNSSNNLRDKQRTLTNDSGASEKMRLDYIKKERERQEKERAKTQLADKQKLHERNKIDLQRREIELRRLHSEATRAQVEMEQYKGIAELEDHKIATKRHEVGIVSDHIQKMMLELAQLKNKSDKLAGELAHEVSQKEYKIKVYEQKEKAYHQAEERTKRESFEMERVRGENIRLDSEIRLLEQKAK